MLEIWKDRIEELSRDKKKGDILGSIFLSSEKEFFSNMWNDKKQIGVTVLKRRRLRQQENSGKYTIAVKSSHS